MTKTLHIFNGDSTAEIFAKSLLKGDSIVWREMLCEGALHKDVGSDTFWKSRYDFFENEMNVPKLEYFDKTIKELIKIEDLSEFDEVVLWFEYDLFCQINLLALCTYLLKHYKKSIRYYLVCVGEDTAKEGMQTLSDYSPIAYETLYQNKIKLSRNNLLYADKCWQVYVENNVDNLKVFNFNKQEKFQYLQQAINQHLQRFPNIKGYNQIETKILEIIDSRELTKNEIVKELLLWQRKATVYGFGDLQYFRYLESLSDFYSVKDEYLTLNEKGKELIKIF